MTHIPIIREWLQSLGMLTAVSISRAEAEMKLAAYIPVLAARFPDQAFTSGSLEHVAANSPKGFPTYAELTHHLATWWRQHRPIPLELPPPPTPTRSPPTPDEIAHVETLVAECIAALRANDPEPTTQPTTPRHLPPEMLDKLNPLPNGRKRT